MQEKSKASEELSDKEWIKEGIENPEKASEILQEFNQKHAQTLTEIEQFRTKLTELTGKASAKEQILMWKGLIAIFETKIELAKKSSTLGDRPIGDSPY